MWGRLKASLQVYHGHLEQNQLPHICLAAEPACHALHGCRSCSGIKRSESQ